MANLLVATDLYLSVSVSIYRKRKRSNVLVKQVEFSCWNKGCLPFSKKSPKNLSSSNWVRRRALCSISYSEISKVQMLNFLKWWSCFPFGTFRMLIRVQLHILYSSCDVQFFFVFSGPFLIFWIEMFYKNIVQAPVVEKLDSAIHRINHYPVDKY